MSAASARAAQTDRLDLRTLGSSDFDEFAPLSAEVEFWRWPLGRGRTDDETREFLANCDAAAESDGFTVWGARRRGTGELMGYVGLSVPRFLPEILPAVEVGWRFAARFWGQGFATEGASVALRVGFEHLGLGEVCSLPQSTNTQSVAVCERLGMIRTAARTVPATAMRPAVEVADFRLDRATWQDNIAAS